MLQDFLNSDGQSMRQLYERTLIKRTKLEEFGYQYVQMGGCEWEQKKESDKECRAIVAQYSKLPPMNIREVSAGERYWSSK